MIIQKDDFKELKDGVKFLSTSLSLAEQGSKIFEYDWFEVPDLTVSQIRSIMGNIDRILFGLDDAELENEILVDNHWMD